MRIGLNLLHALPEIGGGWNYIANLVAALGEYDTANTYVAFVTRASECLVPDRPNFEKALIKIRSGYRSWRILYENTRFPILASRRKLDCLHWFAAVQSIITAVPSVVTVYDLKPFSKYLVFPLRKRFYLRWMMKMTVRRAALLLPISQSTADNLQGKLGADPMNMIVIPVILEASFKPATAETVNQFRMTFQLPVHFWLYVAHTYPHKNHLGLLHAYRKLKVDGFRPWPLVLRGDPGGAEDDIHKSLKELGLEEDVVFLPRLERSEMPVLFSAASALVFPSLYEGCGIPIVEAMACGCPVTASDISPVKEFSAGAATHFDPIRVQAIGQAMHDFQTDTAKRERCRHLGVQRAEMFRPAPTVSKLMGAYHRVVQK